MLCVHCDIELCDMTLGQDHDSNQSFFGGVFYLSRCFLAFSVGVGVFVTGLSQSLSFSLTHPLVTDQNHINCHRNPRGT